MGVVGSDQDSGSEHPNRPSRDVAGAGISLSVGAFPRISIDMLHRSPYGVSCLTTGCSSLLLSCCIFGDWWDTLSEHEQDKVAAFFTLYLWSFLSISRASLDGNR
jgi:hypothetical protein